MKRSDPRRSRRELLRLRTAARELQAPATSASAKPAEMESGDLIRATRPAMGSSFEIRLGATVPGAIELATSTLDLIEAIESQLTIYRDDSEISLLNAVAHERPVPVESRLLNLLQLARRIGNETGGAYDLASGALSLAWGFVRGPRRVPDPTLLSAARARTGPDCWHLDLERGTVHFDVPGVVLNFGAIGKGYAVDRAIERIQAHWWPTTALVHGGRSSLFALGSPPGSFGDRWEIALRNPFRPESPLGMLRLRNRGLGTSGTEFQRFEIGGRVYGHILDPRTGSPADGPASVTVLAPSAAEADALSTAFFLLGRDAGADYIKTHPDVAAVFVEEGPADGSPRVTALGLSSADFVRNPG